LNGTGITMPEPIPSRDASALEAALAARAASRAPRDAAAVQRASGSRH
jgi:hypothetical protein